MRSVDVDDETYDLIVFAARAAGVSVATVVARAVTELRVRAPAGPDVRASPGPSGSSAPSAAASPPGRDVYAIYRGDEVRARYDPATRRVTVTSGALARKVFRTPSAAASAVVAALNPGREMSRIGGMRFWRDAATGLRLDALPPGAGGGSGADVDLDVEVDEEVDAGVPRRRDEVEEECGGVHVRNSATERDQKGTP